MRTFFCEPFLDRVGLCAEKPGLWIPSFGFFRELLRGEAVLAALPEVATDAVDPFPAPPTYGLPLASVIEIVPPATQRNTHVLCIINVFIANSEDGREAGAIALYHFLRVLSSYIHNASRGYALTLLPWSGICMAGTYETCIGNPRLASINRVLLPSRGQNFRSHIEHRITPNCHRDRIGPFSIEHLFHYALPAIIDTIGDTASFLVLGTNCSNSLYLRH